MDITSANPRSFDLGFLLGYYVFFGGFIMNDLKTVNRISHSEIRNILLNYNIITKRYTKHEIQRLSKRKNRERALGARGRHFKLNIKNRFPMLLVYYRLYITYTLAGFLFDLDQSNVYRDTQKIESLIRECIPIPQKIYPLTKKRLETPEEVEKYFPGFMAFTDCTTEQQIPRRSVENNKRKKTFYLDKKKKRHTVKVN